MFQGFNESTIRYFTALRKENSKRVHKENELLYLEGIKYPLEELYFELYNYFSQYDSDLLGNKRRCMSSPYNDARFCTETPIKEYFYVRFKLEKADKRNVPGFFFDASLTGYKYGLNIYNMDARGMEQIRNHMLRNKSHAAKVIEKFHASGLLDVYGETYKKANYPNENAVLQRWLERKKISFIHEAPLNDTFFTGEILNCIYSSFDSIKDVYFMIKQAL